jgi:hypothetical protein
MNGQACKVCGKNLVSAFHGIGKKHDRSGKNCRDNIEIQRTRSTIRLDKRVCFFVSREVVLPSLSLSPVGT